MIGQSLQKLVIVQDADGDSTESRKVSVYSRMIEEETNCCTLLYSDACTRMDELRLASPAGTLPERCCRVTCLISFLPISSVKLTTISEDA